MGKKRNLYINYRFYYEGKMFIEFCCNAGRGCGYHYNQYGKKSEFYWFYPSLKNKVPDDIKAKVWDSFIHGSYEFYVSTEHDESLKGADVVWDALRNNKTDFKYISSKENIENIAKVKAYMDCDFSTINKIKENIKVIEDLPWIDYIICEKLFSALKTNMYDFSKVNGELGIEAIYNFSKFKEIVKALKENRI